MTFGFASPLLLYCAYEVYRSHGESGSADIFWMMQIVALAPWAVLFPLCLLLAGMAILARRNETVDIRSRIV